MSRDVTGLLHGGDFVQCAEEDHFCSYSQCIQLFECIGIYETLSNLGRTQAEHNTYTPIAAANKSCLNWFLVHPVELHVVRSVHGATINDDRIQFVKLKEYERRRTRAFWQQGGGRVQGV